MRKPKWSKDFDGNQSDYTYDAIDRLIKVTTPFVGSSKSITKNYYDLNGNQTDVRTSKNSDVTLESNLTSWSSENYVYNFRGQPLTVYTGARNSIGVLSGAEYVENEYDAAGNLTKQYTGLTSALNRNSTNNSITGTGGALTSYVYNSYGHMTDMFLPGDSASSVHATYVYHLNGMLDSTTDRNGKTVNYGYNGYNLTGKAVYGVESIGFEYTIQDC